MRSTELTLIGVLLLAGCDSHPWYRDAEEFRKDLSKWRLQELQPTDAIATLQHNGFDCEKTTQNDYSYECVRRVKKFPCVQDQAVTMELEWDKRMVKKTTPTVLSNGDLPTRCL
jgi:hypothetical protein